MHPSRQTYSRWLLAALPVGLTLWLRSSACNDRFLFVDEAIYYGYGARLAIPGAHVYSHTSDFKPPLGPMTYWLAMQVSPSHAIAAVHVFTTIAIAATAVLLVVAALRLAGSALAGLVAGLLYPLACGGLVRGEPLLSFSSLEHFQTAWIVASLIGFVLALESRRVLPAVAGGAALGIAALYKQNVPVLLGVLYCLAALGVWRGRLRLSRAGVLVLAATLATAAVVVTAPIYYGLIGEFAAWRFYNVDALALYSETGVRQSLFNRAVILAGHVPAPALSLCALIYGLVRGGYDKHDDRRGELGLACALGWILLFASLIPGLYKAHYVVQGLPLQCLLIGLLVADAWELRTRFAGRRRLLYATGLVAGLGVPLCFVVADLYRGQRDVQSFVASDEYLEPHRARDTLAPLVNYVEQHSDPTDLIYVQSTAPEFYFLTQRRPASSDPQGGWLTTRSRAAVAAAALLKEFKANPPRVLVQLDYRRYMPARPAFLDQWPPLCAWIYKHYRERTTLKHAQVLEWVGPHGIPTLAFRPEAEVSLGDVAPDGCSQPRLPLRFDRAVNGGSLQIGARTFASGIGVSAPSHLIYILNRRYRWFAAEVGVDGTVGQPGRMTFVVETDGQTRFQRSVGPGEPAVPIVIDISGARILALRVTAEPATAGGADGAAGAWAGPRVIRDGVAVPG